MFKVFIFITISLSFLSLAHSRAVFDFSILQSDFEGFCVESYGEYESKRGSAKCFLPGRELLFYDQSSRVINGNIDIYKVSIAKDGYNLSDKKRNRSRAMETTPQPRESTQSSPLASQEDSLAVSAAEVENLNLEYDLKCQSYKTFSKNCCSAPKNCLELDMIDDELVKSGTHLAREYLKY